MKTAKIRVRLEWIALASAMLTLLIGIAYGFQHMIADAAKVRYFRLFTLPFAAVTLVLSWFVITQRPWRLGEPRVAFRLGFVLMAVSFLLTCYFNSIILAPFPWWLPGVGVPVVVPHPRQVWTTENKPGLSLRPAAGVQLFHRAGAE